ncbi:MAG: tyrosine-protein phosphatase [Chitinispirillaceae bacterium]|nr:tyrosine-protein phosphatase [Chitinispirillaceae bacterium]
MYSEKFNIENYFFICSISIFFLGTLSKLFADTSIPLTLLLPENGSVTSDTRPAKDPFVKHSSDSSLPAPTRFLWNTINATGPHTYNFLLAEDTAFTNNRISCTGITDTQCAVWNLKINTNYFWMVSATDSSGTVVNSAIYVFKTPDLWPRMIFIEGTTNVRDIGGRVTMDGKVVAQGLFYRSAEFNQTYTVTTRGLDQLRQLGIVSEIDLRNSSENPQIVMPWLRNFIRPVTDNGGGMDSYSSGLLYTSGTICTVFKALADKRNYPLILHCRIGADRTGTIAALLEALLGMSELQMGQDYIWTSLSVNGIRDTASVEWKDLMTNLRSFDKEHGTIHQGCWNYLQTIGVSVKELIAIRKIFINDDHQPFPELSVRDRHNRKSISPCKSKYCLTLSELALTNRKQLNVSDIFDLTGKKVFFAGKTDPEDNSILKSAQRIHVVKYKE